MLTWRAQALALQGRPPIERQTSLSVLQTSLKNQLGNKADLQIQNDRANLTLKGVEPQALLSWLEQARLNAHVLPNDAKLKRNAAGQWEGRLTLVLPGA
jgi:type II secretory pathway component PulM